MGFNLPNFSAAANLEIESFLEPAFLCKPHDKWRFEYQFVFWVLLKGIMVFKIEVGCDDQVKNIGVKFGFKKDH